MVAQAAESGAFHDQIERQEDILDGDHPALSILLNLPEDRTINSDQVHKPGKEPALLFSYQFLDLSKACVEVHSNYARNMGYYLMRPFIGPLLAIPTHNR
jgi:hypothetical protein